MVMIKNLIYLMSYVNHIKVISKSVEKRGVLHVLLLLNSCHFFNSLFLISKSGFFSKPKSDKSFLI